MAAPAAATGSTTVVAPRAIPVQSFDPSKLTLLPESALPKEATAHMPKRQRTDAADSAAAGKKGGKAKPKPEEGVWLYDGKVGATFQFGTGKNNDDANADFLTCWKGAVWWHGGQRKYFTVQDKTDTGFAVAAATKQAQEQADAAAGKKKGVPTGKLLAQLSLAGWDTNPNSQAAHVYRMMECVTARVHDAICNGMTVPGADAASSSVYRWPDYEEGAVNATFARKFFKNPFNPTPDVNPNTGETYDADVKLKVRYFLKTDKSSGNHTLSLAAPVQDLNTGEALDDPFTLLNKYTHGKWVVTLGNVVVKSDTEINMSLDLERMGLQKRPYKQRPTPAFADEQADDEALLAAGAAFDADIALGNTQATMC